MDGEVTNTGVVAGASSVGKGMVTDPVVCCVVVVDACRVVDWNVPVTLEVTVENASVDDRTEVDPASDVDGTCLVVPVVWIPVVRVGVVTSTSVVGAIVVDRSFSTVEVLDVVVGVVEDQVVVGIVDGVRVTVMVTVMDMVVVGFGVVEAIVVVVAGLLVDVVAEGVSVGNEEVDVKVAAV